MDAVLDRRILSRHAERVPTHRVEDIISLHPPVPGDDVADRIVPHMTHVDPSGRIRKHLQAVIFFLPAGGPRPERVLLLPVLLPPGLYFFGVIPFVQTLHTSGTI